MIILLEFGYIVCTSIHEGNVRSLSHLPPIRDQGTSWTRTHEHSTTAAPCCSSSSRSAGDIIFFAFGL